MVPIQRLWAWPWYMMILCDGVLALMTGSIVLQNSASDKVFHQTQTMVN
jgi:hypothetical protein